MPADTASRTKIRKEFIIKRSRLTPQQIEEKSAKAAELITSLPAFKRAKTIFIYNHIRSELSLDALVRHPASEGKRFAYPFCLPDYAMKALIPGGNWQHGPYGTLEPDPDYSVYVAPEELDLIICPGVAFDKDCHRLMNRLIFKG